MIKDFSELTQRLKNGKCCRVVAIEAIDDHSKEAIEKAESEGWAQVTNIHLSTVEESAAEAVRMIHRGEAEVVMKGILNTDVLLRAIINKDNREEGLLPVGNVLSHVSAMRIPAYHKMLFMSDAAVIPYPTFEQRIAMIRYVIRLCNLYGIEQPRIALIHCTEKVSPKFPITLDYQKIVEMCQAGEFGNAIIDGPSDLKCAVDKESADIKGIHSPLEGNADAVIMPDIEAANVYYKAITAFTDTRLAVGLQGTSCPVTLTSRADSAETKYNSLAMACLQTL
ncbi:MAG: phosphate butyryltransferase [Prevotella sp.]|nr:phosphate butyryltransferase [Prevotella sp.]